MMKDEVVGAAPVGVLTSRGAAAPLSPPASLKPHPTGHRHPTRDGRRLRTAATPILMLALLLPLLLLSDGVCGQRHQRRQAKDETPRKQAKAKTITDLFNTTSCADPPFKCPYPRIEFYLYTRGTQDNPEKLDLLLDAGPALLNTHYDASNPTKLVIHGFGGGRKLSPSPDMRKAYFTRGEYNVIIVDYSSLVVEPCLSQVEWAPRFCALCIAQLIGWLDDAWIWSGGPSLAASNRVARNADPEAQRRGRHYNDRRIVIADEFNPADFGGEEDGSFGQRVAPTTQAPRRDHGRSSGRKVVPTAAPRRLRVVGSPPEAVHVIGYSVGAHIAGLLANYVGEQRIGRITGLDPTIIFYMGNNRSRDLDPSDALFVDVIHTGAGVLGQWGPNGHVDFYVNGGTSQPGCTGGIYETLACDHQKVTPYFIESITSPRGFWATPCPNLVLYLIGWCTTTDKSKLIKMGEDVPRSARGIYYLETNARRPYAKGLPGDSSRRKRQGRG